MTKKNRKQKYHAFIIIRDYIHRRNNDKVKYFLIVHHVAFFVRILMDETRVKFNKKK